MNFGGDTMEATTIKIIVGVLLVQLVAVLAFVLPVHKPEPHEVPVGVVGVPAAAAQAKLDKAKPGAFDVRGYTSLGAAENGIRDREVYGALVPAERRVLVASAASPAVAGMLEQGPGKHAQVTDVVKVDKDDPRGATLNSLFLPLIIASIPAAALLATTRLSRRRLLGALGGLAVAGGLLVVAVVGPVLGLLPGPYLALSAVAALIILAMALPTAGLVRAIGAPGIGLGALTFLLIGNPGSGNGTAPELLPGFWRAVGPLLPPGAGGSALRNVAYFDGAALTRPLLVLAAFATFGTVLVLARRRPVALHHAAPAVPAAA
jgi:hypothetical protein